MFKLSNILLDSTNQINIEQIYMVLNRLDFDFGNFLGVMNRNDSSLHHVHQSSAHLLEVRTAQAILIGTSITLHKSWSIMIRDQKTSCTVSCTYFLLGNQYVVVFFVVCFYFRSMIYKLKNFQVCQSGCCFALAELLCWGCCGIVNMVMAMLPSCWAAAMVLAVLL